MPHDVRVARVVASSASPAEVLIVVEALVLGPLGPVLLALAIDTGSTETVVTPWGVDELGYSPRDGEQITRVRSAIGGQASTGRPSTEA